MCKCFNLYIQQKSFCYLGWNRWNLHCCPRKLPCVSLPQTFTGCMYPLIQDTFRALFSWQPMSSWVHENAAHRLRFWSYSGAAFCTQQRRGREMPNRRFSVLWIQSLLCLFWQWKASPLFSCSLDFCFFYSFCGQTWTLNVSLATGSSVVARR